MGPRSVRQVQFCSPGLLPLTPVLFHLAEEMEISHRKFWASFCGDGVCFLFVGCSVWDRCLLM